jgi:hypothetical protein
MIWVVWIYWVLATVHTAAVKEALQDNPFGNEDEQTPLVILKRKR